MRAFVVTLCLLAAVLTAAPAAEASSGSMFTGRGFDTCEAPSVEAMRAWLASPYRAVGVYVGGLNRACPRGNLSADWVAQVRRLGWRLVPTYVGRQAPCVQRTGLARIDPALAGAQGRAAAADALAAAGRLRLPRSGPLYYDMEAYDTRVAACSRTVRRFLAAWTAELHRRGYRSGVYGSGASTIADLVASDRAARPDDLWFAHWNGVARVYGSPYVPDRLWRPHRRIHQFLGDHPETWGGVTITIDSNAVDAQVVGGL